MISRLDIRLDLSTNG